MASLDRDQNLNKMLSFYEPKVYGAFTGFLRAFEAFLTEHQVQSPVWGAEFFYLEDGHKISFLEDWSVAFDHGFSRYVRQKFPTGTGLADESDLKTVFRSEVSSLFLQSAESVLTTYWMGKMPVTVLGSSPRDCIQRSMPSGKSQLSYTRELVHLYMHDQWISSSLLTNTEKKDLLPFILADQFSSSDAEEKFQFQLPRTDLTEEYRPFGVVEIFSKDESLRKMGLLKFLDDNYRSLYQFSDSFAFTNEWVQGSQHKIKLFQGGALDRLGFAQILKLFMLGQRILLDVQDLPLELDKRLQVFLIENNIKNQTLNFVTAISVFELGDGRLITFDGKKLIGKPEQKNFWHQIFKYFNLTQPEVTMDDDLFSFWKIRSTSGHELNYLDVRRVNFYNPTSYKKHVTINTKNHFAFLRAADSLRASAKSVSQRVEVELLPNGKISLDFGHYEEAPCR
ncbi:MAG TPA: hypothetical protein VNJ01_16300 [Bacteriovoracaceae bacterium]|nr:hypothetical protein [Bacteriovoracaceae bacterium]